MLSVSKDINRTLQDLVNKVNELEKSIHQGSIGKEKPNEQVRIVKIGNGSYQVEFKHKDGWIKSDSTVSSGFKQKEK